MKLKHKDMDKLMYDYCFFNLIPAYHSFDSRKHAKTGNGFPDWVLLTNEGVVYVELKCGRDNLTFDQNMWIRALIDQGHPAFVARETKGIDLVFHWLAGCDESRIQLERETQNELEKSPIS